MSFPTLSPAGVNLQIPAFVRELITCRRSRGAAPVAGGGRGVAGSVAAKGVRRRDKAARGAAVPETASFQALNSARLISL